MCMCKPATVNGQPGYSWDGQTTMTLQPWTPTMQEDESLLLIEQGRCTLGVDLHCHDIAFTKQPGFRYLRWRNGAGEGRVRISDYGVIDAIASLPSDARYAIMYAMVHAVRSETTDAKHETAREWRAAFVQKRIKKRKQKGRVSVWIEQPVA